MHQNLFLDYKLKGRGERLTFQGFYHPKEIHQRGLSPTVNVSTAATMDVVGEWWKRKRRRGNKIFGEDERGKKKKWERKKKFNVFVPILSGVTS